MNTPVPFPSGDAALKLPRRSAAVAAGEESDAQTRWRLEADLADLRERETNLRQYEARLRAWQEQLDGASRVPPPARSAPPFGGSASGLPVGAEFELRDAWEKLHRARALLEAEQKQLRDDRMTLRDQKAELERRQEALAAREAAVAAREQQVAAAVVAPAPVEEPETRSAVQRLTHAPLLAARAVFGSGK